MKNRYRPAFVLMMQNFFLQKEFIPKELHKAMMADKADKLAWNKICGAFCEQYTPKELNQKPINYVLKNGKKDMIYMREVTQTPPDVLMDLNWNLGYEFIPKDLHKSNCANEIEKIQWNKNLSKFCEAYTEDEIKQNPKNYILREDDTVITTNM